MTRETYIKLRKERHGVPLAYNHYYETCLTEGKVPMDFSVFQEWFPQYIGARHIVNSLKDYYDKLFEITIVQTINIKLEVTKEINFI